MEDFGYDDKIIGKASKVSSSERVEELDADIMLKHTHSRTSSTGSGSKNKIPDTEEVKDAVDISNKSEESDQISLPQRFVVKYLGVRETSNLWGIKYTRGPVDTLVAESKRILSTTTGKTLPLLKLEVSEDGITVGAMPQNSNPNFPTGRFPIESISYGVQDLVYTRVFAMIVVKPEKSNTAPIKLSELAKKSPSLPYRCHAFVTDTRETAKNLTFALAGAFQLFSNKVSAGKIKVPKPKKFAIDLRSGEDLAADLLDSEA